MDEQVIASIEALVYDIWRLKERIKRLKKSGESVHQSFIYQFRHKDRQLNQLRSIATIWDMLWTAAHTKTSIRWLRFASGWISMPISTGLSVASLLEEG